MSSYLNSYLSITPYRESLPYFLLFNILYIWGDNIKLADRAWLAGIIDGEGSITIYNFIKTQQSGYKDKNKICTYTAFVIGLSVSNNNKDVIDKIKRITNTNVSVSKISQGKYGNTNYRWKVSSRKDILRILKEVKPYLVAKKIQANLMIEFINIRNENGYSKKTEEQKDRMVFISEKLSLLNRLGQVKQ